MERRLPSGWIVRCQVLCHHGPGISVRLIDHDQDGGVQAALTSDDDAVGNPRDVQDHYPEVGALVLGRIIAYGYPEIGGDATLRLTIRPSDLPTVEAARENQPDAVGWLLSAGLG